MGLFRKTIHPKETQVRTQLAWELGKTVGPEQIASLKQYLDDKSVEVRRAAMSSLEQQWPTGNSIAIRILSEKLKDSDS